MTLNNYSSFPNSFKIQFYSVPKRMPFQLITLENSQEKIENPSKLIIRKSV